MYQVEIFHFSHTKLGGIFFFVDEFGYLLYKSYLAFQLVKIVANYAAMSELYLFQQCRFFPVGFYF